MSETHSFGKRAVRVYHGYTDGPQVQRNDAILGARIRQSRDRVWPIRPPLGRYPLVKSESLRSLTGLFEANGP